MITTDIGIFDIAGAILVLAIIVAAIVSDIWEDE